MNTTATIRQQFKELLKAEKVMKAHGNTDGYYTREAALKNDLAAFVRTDLRELTTKELLKLCSMVGSYRPVALHTFLIYCANLIND